MQLTLRRLQPKDRDWKRMDGFADRVVFQSREWLQFVAGFGRAEPVVAAVRDGTDTVGYFQGLVARRFGVPILASPLRGWSTWYMGFNLVPEVSRASAVEGLVRFAFDDLRCPHVELRDRHLSHEDVRGLSVSVNPETLLEVDLSPPEEELIRRMTPACRRCIRKAEKIGVTVEEAHDLEFAQDFHAQLRDVFAKQKLGPPYDVSRVRRLIQHLGPTGRLLLLRARDPEGRCIATGIFPAMNKTMYFWGGASWREHQILRPNEAVMWYAMRYWKARGMESCDLGGRFPPYKRKFGSRDVPIISLVASKYRALLAMRNLMKSGYRQRQRISVRLGAPQDS